MSSKRLAMLHEVGLGVFFVCVWPVRGSRGGGECCVGVRKAAGAATRDDPARDDTYRGSYFGMRRSSSFTSLISR